MKYKEKMSSSETKITIDSVVESSIGNKGVRVSVEDDSFIYSPGYVNVASCQSEITFIDGDQGILLHRGYEITELSSKCDFLDVVYLLLNGELPHIAQAEEFKSRLAHHEQLPDCVLKNIRSFQEDAHPMALLISAFASTAGAFYSTPFDKYSETLIACIPRIVAYIYRHVSSREFIPPDEKLSYTENFLNMMFGKYDKDHAKVLDTILLLHADHEQNPSTSTARMVASSGANIGVALSAATSTLWGPLHGGANEKVLEMLERITSGQITVDALIEKVKNKEEKLMGFGHRVYKNYDPRSYMLKESASKLLSGNSPILEVAQKLEEIAVNDPYFIERKLYPNVDFYSGIALNAIGIPTQMFTLIFALGRTSGWIAQVKEFLHDKEQKIVRPRQIYIGRQKRTIS